MKNVGIVGLPETDAGSVFTALTSIDASSSGKASQAVVSVPDPRVDKLVELHESKKATYAQLRFVDTSSLVRAGGRSGAGKLSAELLGHLRNSDALLAVVRGDQAANDLDEIALEFLYADLDVISKKVERDRKGARDAEAKRVLAVMERALTLLEDGKPLSVESWSKEDLADFGSMAPLTLKPRLVVATIDDGSAELPQGVVGIAPTLELEVAGMQDAEAAELLEGFGITERALPRVIRGVYDALSLLTFLTAGDIESRAWEIHAGATAPEAAGAIHSDIQRGFIRAEVVAYDALVEAGSWTAARAQGLVRQEGKAYVMTEGDVVEFRFAV
jgi:ribosome-binding ATPase